VIVKKIRYVDFFSYQIQRHATNPNINANLFFANSNNDARMGIAYLANICSSELKYRIGIVEWTKTDSLSGQVSYNYFS
jgi:hypothetical protein